MAEQTVKVWQCIGCGRIEAPQECVGICEFKRIDMVYAFEHEKALERCAKFEELVRYLARITPREGEWERSWKALQVRARAIVAEAEAGAAEGAPPPAPAAS
jgi:hypothetical protein